MAVDPIDPATTGDTFKCGDENREIQKVAVTMFPTKEVIDAAAAFGADLLIVHEPVYHENSDRAFNTAIAREKRAYIEKTGLTVFRFHDYAHAMVPDLIAAGELRALGLPGNFEKGPQFAVNRYILDEPMTGAELARHIEKTLGIRHMRVIGCLDKPGRRLGLSFGTPGLNEIDECDFILRGEICEWATGEEIRDLAQFGYNKAIFVMGHCASEREGMKLLCDIIRERHPELDVTYLESGEPFRDIV